MRLSLSWPWLRTMVVDGNPDKSKRAPKNLMIGYSQFEISILSTNEVEGKAGPFISGQGKAVKAPPPHDIDPPLLVPHTHAPGLRGAGRASGTFRQVPPAYLQLLVEVPPRLPGAGR